MTIGRCSRCESRNTKVQKATGGSREDFGRLLAFVRFLIAEHMKVIRKLKYKYVKTVDLKNIYLKSN